MTVSKSTADYFNRATRHPDALAEEIGAQLKALFGGSLFPGIPTPAPPSPLPASGAGSISEERHEQQAAGQRAARPPQASTNLVTE